MPAVFASVLAVLLCIVPSGGWLGVYLAADREEAVITEVLPDSPAAKAGLKAGDVFVSVGDTATPTREKLVAAIGAASPGDRVKIKVQRDGESVVVVVKLGKRPSDNVVAETAPPAPVAPGRGQQPQAPRGEFRAVEVDVAPAAPGVFLGISVAETDRGLVIERVLDHSPAKAAGFVAGERLGSIGDKRLRTLADLDKAIGGLRAGKAVAVGLVGEDATRSVMLTPAPRVAAGRIAGVPAAEAPREVVVEEVEVHGHEGAQKHGHAKAGRKEVEEAEEAEEEEEAEEREQSAELEALRRQLAELKKELQELREQVRRQRRGR